MAKMNPNYPMQRGCWIEKTADDDGNIVKFTLHDYPHWRLNNGDYVGKTLDADSPAGFNSAIDFISYAELKNFAAEEKYVICDRPKTPEERAELIAKYGSFSDDAEDS